MISFSGNAIINLAARVSVSQSLENPRVYYETNAIGILNLFKCRKNYGEKNMSSLQPPASSKIIIRYHSAKTMIPTDLCLHMLLQKKQPKHCALPTIIFMAYNSFSLYYRAIINDLALNGTGFERASGRCSTFDDYT